MTPGSRKSRRNGHSVYDFTGVRQDGTRTERCWRMRVAPIVLFGLTLSVPAYGQATGVLVLSGGYDYGRPSSDGRFGGTDRVAGAYIDVSISLFFVRLAWQLSNVDGDGGLCVAVRGVDPFEGTVEGCGGLRVSRRVSAFGPRVRLGKGRIEAYGHVLFGGSRTCVRPSDAAFLRSSIATTGDLMICEEGSTTVYGLGVDVFPSAESRYGFRVGVNRDEVARLALGFVVRF